MVSEITSETMSIIFPKGNECRIKEDPIVWIKNFVSIHGLSGKRKYFWPPSAFLKAIIVLCRTVYAVQNFDDPQKVAELVVTYPLRFMAVFKMFYCYYDRKRIDYFYQTINEEFWDFHIAGPKVEAQVKKRYFYVNLIVKNQFVASFVCLALLIVFPLVPMPDGMRFLPNIIWTPFDTNPSPLYEIVFVMLTWALTLTVMGNFFYDMTFIYCIEHLTVQLTLLGGLLRNITYGIMGDCSDDEKFDSIYFQNAVMNRLKICVNHHCKLLKFGQQLELFSSKILVPQLLMAYVTFVVIGYNISAHHDDFWKTVILFNLTLVSLIQVALYAIPSSDMEVESLSLIRAMYESEWYLFKAPLKRALTLIMLNMERGLTIRAGGMVNVDKPVLLSLIQKAFSAITLLRALIDEADVKNDDIQL